MEIAKKEGKASLLDIEVERYAQTSDLVCGSLVLKSTDKPAVTYTYGMK